MELLFLAKMELQEVDLAFQLKQLKSWTIYIKQWLSNHRTSGNERVICEWWEENKMRPVTAQLILESGSRLQRRRQQLRRSPAVSLSWGKRGGSSGRARLLESADQSTGENRTALRENSRALHRVPISLQLSTDHAGEETTRGQGKDHSKSLENT